MEQHETVLSDVHVYTKNVIQREIQNCTDNIIQNDEVKTHNITVALSRFPFEIQREVEDMKMTDSDNCLLDEDGDLLISRKHPIKNEVIILEHALATPLALVGLQVWNGALYLGDFLLNNTEKWKDCIALEMGSGIGFCSIVLGMFSKTVFCTDIGNEVLELCSCNVSRNISLFRNNNIDNVFIRELNWTLDDPFLITGKWKWNEQEKTRAAEATVYFASDVIYDDHITDAFFVTIQNLFGNKKNCTLYLSLEKRLNFTLDELTVAAPAYQHFLDWLNKLKVCKKWKIELVRPDFPQQFEYDRTEYLELWKIQSS